MAIPQSSIIALSLMYTKLPPSASDLTYWASPAGQAVSWEQAVQAFSTSSQAKTAYPMLASPTVLSQNAAARRDYVTQAFQNLYGIAAAAIPAAELTYWADTYLVSSPQAIFDFPVVLNQYSPASRQQALTNRAQVAENFAVAMAAAGSSTFTQAQYISGWGIVDTVTADAATVTAANAQITQFIAGGGGGGGQTFVFTTALDNLVGTATNDTFNGDNSAILAQQTVQLGDVANGGEGTDTFNYFGPTNNVIPQLSNIENVNLIQGSGGAFDFAAAAGKGLKSVTVDTIVLGGTTTTIQGIGGVGLTLKGNFNDNNLTADFGNSATEAQIATNAVDKGGTFTVEGNKLTTLNFTATGSSKFTQLATAVKAAAVNTIKVSGDGKSLSFSDNTAVANSIKTIDASGLTAGGLTVAFGTGITSFKGGKGDDIVRSNTLTTTTDSAVDAGEGTKDRLIVNTTADVNTTARANVYANFEVLQSDGQQVDMDLFAKSAFVALRSAGASVFNNVTATQAGDVTIFGIANTPTFNLKTATGTSDTLNITVSDGLEAVNTLNINNLTAPNVEILKFTTTDNTTVGTLVNAPSASTITATGAGTFTLTTGARPLGTGFSIDASGVTANVTIDASLGTGNGAIIKGASSSPAAVNTLFGSAQNDIIAGGSGSDLLDGNAGQDTLTGGAGVDQFIYDGGFASNAGAANVDRITDFVAGVGGDQFQFATGPNNVLNVLNFAANATVNINTAQTVATAANINDVFAGIAAITASTNTKLEAVLVTVSAGLAAGTYLYANNSTGAVSNADDFLVNVSGISGTLSVTPTTGNFIFV